MELASHQPMLTALAARLVGTADADDIVQETFLRALARPPAVAGAPMAPWLATVARNLAVDLLRHRGRHVELDDDPPLPTETDADPLPHRGLATLLAGLGGLTHGEVTVLLLRDGLDLDVGEVAAALETSPESVRVLHHRARKKAVFPSPLDRGLAALDTFLTWLLARSVAGLPVGGRAGDPGLARGVLVAHLSLLDAIIEVARADRNSGVEGRARLSRGTARLALGRRDAEEDLRLALSLGADRTLAEARLGPMLFSRGEPDQALELVLSALARADHPRLHGPLHRVAAQVYRGRADLAAAEPHLAALRALAASDSQDAYAAVASASIAMSVERFEDARADLLVALSRVRASGNSRNEAGVLNNLTFATICTGDLAEAAARAEEGLALARALGDGRREATLIGNVALLAQLDGRLDDAAAGYQRAIVQCRDNAMAYEAEVVRTYAAVLEHQRRHAEQAAADLGEIVDRLAELPGMALHARVQRFVALAELGRAAPAEFEALARDAANMPSFLQILAVGRLVLERDPVAMDRALERPVGTSPFERIVRAILARIILAEKNEPSR